MLSVPKCNSLCWRVKTLFSSFAGLAVMFCVCSCDRMPAPYGPVPTEGQLAWQKMEMNMFCHFGPNTFSGKEWGDGTEAEDIFNPTALDCNQWVEVAKSGGFGGIILTAKHHDGFCLWPNPVSSHTVVQSTWRGGKGDVLRELSDACTAGGVGFGLYISPWDRNAPEYGSDAYNEVFRRTVEDANSRYATVFEQWFDGANGEGPNGRRQVYDWPLFCSEVYRHNPDAVIFSDVGPGCRWVGNERGVAGETNWSRLDVDGFEPGAAAPSPDTLSSGNVFGARWIPSEADVSIRPGWFWHKDESPKDLRTLLDIYYTSVGRNAVLLLNVPPDDRGLICTEDSARVSELGAALRRIFADNLAAGAAAEASRTRGRTFAASNLLDGDYDSFWAAPDRCRSAELTLTLPQERTFNRIMLQEYIPLGQRVSAFHVEALVEAGACGACCGSASGDSCGHAHAGDGCCGGDAHAAGGWRTIASGTTIGYKRILLTDDITASAVRIVIDDSLAPPVLNGFGLYLDDII